MIPSHQRAWTYIMLGYSAYRVAEITGVSVLTALDLKLYGASK